MAKLKGTITFKNLCFVEKDSFKINIEKIGNWKAETHKREFEEYRLDVRARIDFTPESIYLISTKYGFKGEGYVNNEQSTSLNTLIDNLADTIYDIIDKNMVKQEIGGEE